MRTIHKILAPAAAIAALGGVAGLHAQNQPAQLPGQTDASRVVAGTYTVDGGHTLVQWSVDHFGFNPYYGLFGDVEGALQLDPANLSATKLDVTVPITSLAVVSDGLREHMLRAGKDGGKPDFFGTAPAPARFISTQVRRTGERQAQIAGNLTLNGVTKPVTIAAEFTGAGDNPMNKKPTIGFTGTTMIKRSEFGMNFAVPMVSDEVKLNITAAFERQ